MTQISEQIEDHILWKNIKSGDDKRCFNELFKKHYSELFYYGIKIVPTPDFVKECVQDVFVRIWETRLNLGEIKNVKSYLIVSVRRMILTKKKKTKGKQTIEISKVEDSPFVFEFNEFEKHIEISDELRYLLVESINSLTENQRELVMLYFYHGLSYSEIAEVLGINLQSVRNLMYRTLIKLRKTIGNNRSESINNIVFLIFTTIPQKKF